MKFKDIKKFPASNYRVDVPWDYLQAHLDHWNERESPLLLQPSFQRGYVWSEKQQREYCEYVLRGGTSGREIYFNCSSWGGKYNTPIECVDGQQRIGAALAFMNDKIKVFGHYLSEFEDSIRLSTASFSFHVAKLSDRAEIIEWYLSLNRGGSVHTDADLRPAYEELQELRLISCIMADKTFPA